MSSTLLLGLSTHPSLLTFLRLGPLLSSTASLTHAYLELVTTSSFLSRAPTDSALSKSFLDSHTTSTTQPVNVAQVAEAKEKVIPVWFVTFFNRGVWSVIGLNSLTLLSSAANLWLYPAGLGEYRKFYLAGLAAGFAHFAFVPLVGPSIERLFRMCVRQEKGEDASQQEMSAVANMREWVGVHKMRMGTVDLVAWASFVVGAVGVLTPST